MDKVFQDGVFRELTQEQLDGLLHAMESLKPREKQVLCLRYEKHQTQKQIADAFGLSTTRIAQIASKGIRKLRHPSRVQFLRETTPDAKEVNDRAIKNGTP